MTATATGLESGEISAPVISPGELERLRAVAGAVPDPEIPVLTLIDLGILRDVEHGAGELAGTVIVTLTPTYTGCPATAVIAGDVTAALQAAGADRVIIRTVLTPAWTTDWMSAEGRQKLLEYGIAPPGQCSAAASGPHHIGLTLGARCPRCGSMKTREVSRFGSTPCKSHWTCQSCLEPFDSFKTI